MLKKPGRWTRGGEVPIWKVTTLHTWGMSMTGLGDEVSSEAGEEEEGWGCNTSFEDVCGIGGVITESACWEQDVFFNTKNIRKNST